ncbi:MAG: hypothetical protein LQ347_005725 [Umbilicaria vellea]|nr:MAG: hypothetical protein LQ347_005725 [Umbilicaria vellea]
MFWNETVPGLYQRSLGGVERGMLSAITSEQLISREPIQIRCIAHFSAPTSSDRVAQAFKDAWKALRLLKSPDIATTFGDGYKYYKVPSSQELEAWLNESFTVTQTGTPVHIAITDRQLRPGWLPVCYIVPQPTEDATSKGFIILFISHWRTEASGAFKIVNQLLDYASDLLNGTSTREALLKHTLGSEIQLLTPTLEDILMPDQHSSPEAKTRIESYFADYYSKLPCIDFPIQGSPSAGPSYVKVNQRIYSPAPTSSLISACRANGITVTSAIHSAYLGVVWHVAESSKRNRSYACVMPAQVRKRLPTSSPYREQGCWNSAQLLMLTAPAGQEFLTRARGFRKQYGLADQETWLHEDMRAMSERMLEPPGTSPAEPEALPFFTSMGVLDGDLILSEHGGMKVEKVAVWADPTGPGIVLSLWTFRGRLNIQISWNIAFHGDGQIQEVMDMIDTVLAVELEVKMGIEEVRGADCLY